MNVFISWSGAKSREVAETLPQWLPGLVPGSEPWMDSDLPAGSDWTHEITNRLQRARAGIICLTDENKNSPWLLFEAGALTRSAQLYLYLIDLETKDLAGPLSHFAATTADRNGSWRLVAALNNAAEQPVPENVLRDQFDDHWPDLEVALAAVRAPRVETVSIVFADVVGSTRLYATSGDLAVGKGLQEFFARATELLRVNKGRALKFIGDAFIGTFPTTNDAFVFASELQRSLSERPILIGEIPLTVGIGLHCGEVQLVPTSYGEDNILGSTINLAARITSMARPGEILFSGDAYAQIRKGLKPLVSPVEQVKLKGIANSVELFRYLPTGAQ